MCLALLALHALPGTPLLLIGNRDEFHARPSAPAAPWAEDAGVAGGRDLQAGGSWLAVRNDGRFALVTNHRAGPVPRAALSRGTLVTEFLLGDGGAARAAQTALRHADQYAPFHLLLGDGTEVWRVDCAPRQALRLQPGLHPFGNGPADALWPRQQRLLQRFRQTARQRGAGDDDALLALLADRTQPPDAELPQTGIGLARERQLAPVFIAGEDYGTRASNVLRMGADGSLCLRERRFGPAGTAAGESLWYVHAPGAPWRAGPL